MIALAMLRPALFLAALAIASLAVLAGCAAGGTGLRPSAVTPAAAAEPADTTLETGTQATLEPYPFGVVCEEAEEPALTCAAVIQRLLDQLGMESAEWARIEVIEVAHRCDPACVPAASFVVTFVAGNLVDGSMGPGELFQMMSSETALPDEDPES